MNNRNTALLATAMLLGALTTFSACQRAATTQAESKPSHTEKSLGPYWTELSRIPAALPRRTETLPANYRVLKLDLPALRQHLSQTHGNKAPVKVAMPLVTGEMSFSVTESAVMDPKLASKYPQLKTYTGTSAQNPTAALRMELSSRGLKATVTEGSVRYMIEPYLTTDSTHYLSYERASPRVQGQRKNGIQLKGTMEQPAQAND